MRARRTSRTRAEALRCAVAAGLTLSFSCNRGDEARAAPSASARVPAPAASASPSASATPTKVDFVEPAMGTEVHFVAYATPALGEAKIRDAMRRAHAEIVRIEGIMTSWRDDSDIGRVNKAAGTAVAVSDETA